MAPSLEINEAMPLQLCSGTRQAPARLGINGLGRIGRLAFRQALSRSDLTVVAINHTCATADDLVYLIRHDSTHGNVADNLDIRVLSESLLAINGQKIALTSTRDISQLRWAELGAEYVLECTGKFKGMDAALQHVTTGGAKRVVISAPSSDAPTFVYGVNSDHYLPTPENRVISSASCTTNCATPVLKVLDDVFGIDQAFLTTVHAATQSQQILDGYGKKSRRLGRSIMNNIIPTTTGASKAVGAVLPELRTKVAGISIRVPTPDVSMIDLSVETTQPTSLASILDAFKEASQGGLAGVLDVSDEELVSSDLLGSRFSATVDAKASMELNPRFFKIIAWYDNEWAYANRMLDLASMMHNADIAPPQSTAVDLKLTSLVTSRPNKAELNGTVTETVVAA